MSFGYEEAEEAYKADPESIVNRRTLAFHCINRNELNRARSLLSFMTRSGPDQDPQMLRMLASAYQRSGDHSNALYLYEVVVRDFPHIAQTDKVFRKMVKTSEKASDRTDSILPKRKYNLVPIGTAAAGVVLVLLVAFLVNMHKVNNQPLYVINGLDIPVSVDVPGHGALDVPPYGNILLEVPEGKHEATVKAGSEPPQEMQFEITNTLFQRFFDDRVFILNAGGWAVMAWEEILYSESPGPSDRYNMRLHVAEPFMVMEDIDFKFVEYPKEIKLSSGTPEMKSRISVADVKGVNVVAVLQQQNIPLPQLIAYMENHVKINKQDAALLRIYIQYTLAMGLNQRALKLLSEGLTQRPVLVDWHRSYQEIKQMEKQTDDLLVEYDTLLANEPDNSALLYLRGRIAPERDEADMYFDRAARADSNNPYPYYAKGYGYACRGNFVDAREQYRKVMALDPGLLSIQELYFEMRFATGQYSDLEEGLRLGVAGEPASFDYFERQLQLMARKGDKTAMQKRFQEYKTNYLKEFPEDSFKLIPQAELTLAYLQKDFTALAELAKKQEDGNYRNEQLMIAYLNTGQIDKIEALPGFNEQAGAYTNLVLWLGWMDKGDKEKAAPYLKKAKELFDMSYNETKEIAALLEIPAGKIAPKLYNLDILPEDKRVLYTVFARLYPRERQELLRWAQKMNYSFSYPHYFLETVIKSMKR